MDLGVRPKSSLPSYESVHENIAKLRGQLCSKLSIFMRNVVGSI